MAYSRHPRDWKVNFITKRLVLKTATKLFLWTIKFFIFNKGAIHKRAETFKSPPGWKARDRCYDFGNIFAEKFCEKIGVLTQNKAKICKNLIITLVFEKNANFFAKNCQKSQKIVIITSTPGIYLDDLVSDLNTLFMPLLKICVPPY
jgi:hypothetical protein